MIATVDVSFERFLCYLQSYLDKSTELTTHRCCHKRFTNVVSGDMSLKRFTVKHLRQFRDHLISESLSRKTIREYLNKTIRWIGFAWEQGEVSQETFLACKNLWMPNPRQGRPAAKTVPVKWSDIVQILPYLSQTVANLLQLHWHTGSRPNEIVQINSNDLETVSPDLTLWHLKTHKGSWRGEDRTLFLGGPAMSILQGMKPSTKGYYFPSVQNKKGFISRLTYQRLVKKCTVVLTANGIIKNPSEWTIRGIRNGRAKQVQQCHGIEAARVLLGHTSQAMTSHYVGNSMASPELIKAINF